MTIPEFKLERYFARYEFVAPYLMCSSDVETMRMADLLELADGPTREIWDDLTLGYTEYPGHPRLREEISGLYADIAPEQVTCFAGAEEAVFVTLSSLLQPGDHAIAFWPGYQSLYEVARAAGAEVTLIELREADGWAVDMDAVRKAMRPNTKLIVVNAPHNPTGALIPPRDLRILADLADDAGAHLFGDEVYRLLEHDSVDRLPAAADLATCGISLGVMSKAFGLAGLRIGWIASRDPEVHARAAALKDYTSICNSAPSEVLALIALKARETILARNRALVTENLARLDRFFLDHSDRFTWVRPRAGCIGFPRLRGDVPVEQFAEEMVERAGVLVLPGTMYDHPGGHFRVGFGRRNFSEALERFAAAL